MNRAVIARAPTRLDFGGGWTDVPPYPEREGGAVCNVAITRYATVTAATGEPGAGSGCTRRSGEDDLIRAALRRSGSEHADVRLSSDFPVAAGLGGSAAAGVALAGALAILSGSPLQPHALAALSRDTEVAELGVPGGFQDHYAASFGGALLITFANLVQVRRLGCRDQTFAELAQRGVLVYSGESRLSGATITAVSDAYRAGDRVVVDALTRMKALAVEMADALVTGDLDALGALTGEHWIHQRALHPSITTARIDAIMVAASRAGALGAKALGASGGGCVLAIAARGREDELARALSPFGERLSYAVDTRGFDVVDAVESTEASMEGETR